MSARPRIRRGPLAGIGVAALTSAAVLAGSPAAAAPADEPGSPTAGDEAIADLRSMDFRGMDLADMDFGSLDFGSMHAGSMGAGSTDAGSTELPEPQDVGLPEPEDVDVDVDVEGMTSGDVRAGDMTAEDLGQLVPENLRQDLDGVHDLPAGERPEAIQEIMSGALSGEYGEAVERRAEATQNVWFSLPTDLRSDVTSALSQEPEQARDDVAEVFQDAREGKYGSSVEAWSDWMAAAGSELDVSGAGVEGMTGGSGG